MIATTDDKTHEIANELKEAVKESTTPRTDSLGTMTWYPEMTLEEIVVFIAQRLDAEDVQ